MLDEVKLAENVSFNPETCQFDGFVDPSQQSSKKKKKKKGQNQEQEEQKDQVGDHAMVFMYQPFQGGWVQTLGAFLTKGTTGEYLHSIVLESIILVEQTGFKVDAIISDGASWNRAMWGKFE